MRLDRSKPAFLAAVIGALSLSSVGVHAADEGKIPITTASKEAREHYVKGFALASNFQTKEAYQEYQQAIARDPDFAMAYLGAANTGTSAKEFFDNIAKAVALLDKVSEGERLWIEGAQAGGAGNPQKQLELLLKLVALHPQDEQAHVLLGVLYFGRQDYDKAIAELNAATKIKPDLASPYNMLGYSYRALEKYPEAEAAFKRYAEVLPDNPNPYDSYAELLLKLGRFDESIQQYQKALAVDPHFVASHYGIAADLIYQGKHDEARKQLQKALDTARDDGERRGALGVMAISYIDQDEDAKALEQVKKQYALAEKIQDASNMAGDLNFMGLILLESGKPDEALAKFEAAQKTIEASSLDADVKQNSKDGFLFNLARVALAKNEVANAKVPAEKFSSQASESKNVFQVRAAHQLAGLIALHEKDYDKAIAELKQASDQNPYSVFHLAKAYEGKGDSSSARAAYEKVAKWNQLASANYSWVRHQAVQKVAAGS